MSLRAERYREKATHCEQAAEYVTDAATKTLYLDTRHQLAAGLYAPLRVILYEDETGST
jgi:hypothetical protein